MLGDTEFQGNLFAILDQKGARSELITNEWLLRCAVKCDRNCFFEGLFPTAAKFNHSILNDGEQKSIYSLSHLFSKIVVIFAMV